VGAGSPATAPERGDAGDEVLGDLDCEIGEGLRNGLTTGSAAVGSDGAESTSVFGALGNREETGAVGRATEFGAVGNEGVDGSGENALGTDGVEGSVSPLAMAWPVMATHVNTANAAANRRAPCFTGTPLPTNPPQAYKNRWLGARNIWSAISLRHDTEWCEILQRCRRRTWL
jgi:hypothetical protein